jgi:hypothetical protein
MQRTLTVLIVGLASALALTGCPEKKAEKEAPASADDPVNDQSGAAEDKKKEEKAEKADDKKKEGADDDKDDKKDEGGW